MPTIIQCLSKPSVDEVWRGIAICDTESNNWKGYASYPKTDNRDDDKYEKLKFV